MADTSHAPRQVLAGLAHVARSLEDSGYQRVWYAEHHSSLALVDAPPAVAVAHAASSTSTIRVGSGGVLALNHAPLSLAEQFGALASFHPGRVDVGIGRGRGTVDQAAADALRLGAGHVTDEEYPERVTAVLRYLAQRPDVPEPWLLASSTGGAMLAARLGLPLAFAYHIRPRDAVESLDRYRGGFVPSQWAQAPRVLVSVETICAETDIMVAALARPAQLYRAQALARGIDRPMLDMAAAGAHILTAEEEAVSARAREHAVHGTPVDVRARLTKLAAHLDVDELMLFTPVVDWTARTTSFQLIMSTIPSTD